MPLLAWFHPSRPVNAGDMWRGQFKLKKEFSKNSEPAAKITSIWAPGCSRRTFNKTAKAGGKQHTGTGRYCKGHNRRFQAGGRVHWCEYSCCAMPRQNSRESGGRTGKDREEDVSNWERHERRTRERWIRTTTEGTDPSGPEVEHQERREETVNSAVPTVSFKAFSIMNVSEQCAKLNLWYWWISGIFKTDEHCIHLQTELRWTTSWKFTGFVNWRDLL